MSRKKLGGGAAIVGGVVLAAAAALGLLNGNAVDTAGSPLSVAQAQQLKASGTSLFVQALTWWPSCSNKTSVPSTAVQSLANARAAGLTTAGYILLSPYQTGKEAVDLAYNAIGPESWNQLRFAAIDFEIPQGDGSYCYSAGTRIPRQTICDALDELSRRGAPRVLYTSYGEWTGHLEPSNPPMCANTYIWNASWGGDVANPLPYPFGGVTADQVVAKQIKGDTQLGALSADIDSFMDPFPWEVPPPFGGVPPQIEVIPNPLPAYVSGITVHFSDGSSWELAAQPPAGR